MSIDIYSTHALTRAVNDLASGVRTFLLGMFFAETVTEDSKEVHFDVEKGKKRIAPFVSPVVEGKVVEQLGFEARSFEPAYIKAKAHFQPDKPLRRAYGEPIGGTFSPMERRAINLRRTLTDHSRMITRRLEVMASEILRTGQVTISGEGFDTKVVDFLRDASLTIALTGGVDTWDEAASDPIGDLETWAGLVQKISGVAVTEIVMAPDAWIEFRQKQDVKDLLDTRRGSMSRAELGPMADFVQDKGTIGQFRIWVYDDTYIDDADVEQNLIPSGTVIGASRMIEGVQHFGTIQDEANAYGASMMFSKSWLEEDPAVRWLLTQSAPLVVPFRPDASFSASVLP